MKYPGKKCLKLLITILLAYGDYVIVQMRLYDVSLRDLGAFLRIHNASIAMWALWMGMLCLRLKAPPKEKVDWRICDYTLCGGFSVFMVLADSYVKTDSLSMVFGSGLDFACSTITLCLFFSFSFLLFRWIKYIVREVAQREFQLPKLWETHPFFFPFCIIFAAWIPFAVIKYPAGIEWDAYFQIMEVLGEYPFTAHWPPVSSLFLGGMFQFGKMVFGSNNRGIFFVVVMQMMICDACLSYSLYILNRLRIKNVFQWMVLGIYSLSTILSRYFTSLVKDALFSCFVVMLIACTAEILYDKRTQKRGYILYFTGALLVSLLRNNGIYILIFLLIGLIFILRRERQKKYIVCSGVVLSVIVFYVLYSNMFLPTVGIVKGSVSEALSIPFQQTARYVVMHAADVTEEEKKIIDSVLRYDEIAQVYDPRLSDPIKNMYHGDGESLKKYLKVWAVQFAKHPETYISATFHNAFGFFYPDAKETTYGHYLSADEEWRLTHLRSVNPSTTVREPLFQEPACLAGVKSRLQAYVLWFESCPLFFLFCNCGMQIWLFIYMAMRTLVGGKNKRRNLLLMLPSLCGILVCIAGPTFFHNGIRYALPIICANPFLFCMFMNETVEADSLSAHSELR